MNSKENPKNYILFGAVEADDVDEVRKQLEAGANPNYTPKLVSPLLNLALQNKNLKIIELLVQRGANVTQNFLKQIFKPDYNDISKDITVIVVKHKGRDIKLLQNISVQLMYSDCRKLKILELLFDYGLPIDGYLNCSGELLTPLQMAIFLGDTDLVSKLFIAILF